MAFKSEQKNLTFSDLEKSFKKKRNRSLETLMNLEKTILWDRIESILLKDYPVGQKKEGNRAYPPLLLFKCLLLQKWFRIKSDPELESQINDRESFQIFLGISANQASPDHSTFSKFRKRLTKGKFEVIVGDILNQFSDKGYHGEPNRTFLAMNKFKDGIMRKDEKNAKMTEYEIERNKKISKIRYIGVLFLVMGTFFTVSFLFFQMKRQQVIDRYHQITSELKKWE